MSFTINDIHQLFDGAYFTGLDQGLALTAAPVLNVLCHNYSLIGTSNCGTLGSLALYLEIASFNPIKYVTEIKGEEDGDGLFKSTWRKKDAEISFPLVLDEALINLLERISLSELVVFNDLRNSTSTEIFEIELSVSEEGSYLGGILKFKCKGVAKVVQSCCGSFYDGAPFDECDGSGTSDPNTDPECVGYTALIQVNGSQLDASTSGGPTSGIETFIWYLDSVQIGTGSSVTPAQPGTYKVVATKGNCQAEDEHVWQDCTSFVVTIEQNVLTEGTIVLIAQSNRVATFQWQKDTGGGFVDIAGETDSIYYPDVNADYRVNADALGCLDTSNQLTVTLGVVCAGLFSLDVSRVDDVLTADITGYSGVDTPTYQWWKDLGDGSGLVLIVGETSQTYTSTERGLFQVYVTLDGCVKFAFEIIVDDCILFKAYIETIVDQGIYARLTAASINPPSTVTYQWQKWGGEQWEDVFTGNPYDLPDAQVIRLVTTSGLCTKYDLTKFCVDPASVDPYQKFYGTGTGDAELHVYFTVTATGLIVGDPGTLTENELNAGWIVTRNGVGLSWGSLVDIRAGGSLENDRTRFGFDFANNRVEVPNGWKAANGEIIEIRQI